jgi:hypothetical protein
MPRAAIHTPLSSYFGFGCWGKTAVEKNIIEMKV